MSEQICIHGSADEALDASRSGIQAAALVYLKSFGCISEDKGQNLNNVSYWSAIEERDS